MSAKLEFYAYTPWEIAVFNEAYAIVVKAREAQAAQFHAPPEVKLEQAIVADMGDAQAEESVVGPGVVGAITPEGVAKNAVRLKAELEGQPVPAVTETEMAMVVQKSLDTRGLAATRELLAPITGGKRWRETDPAVWPEIKKVLS